MSHEKAMNAAISEAEDIDWVSCLAGTGIGSCEQLFEAQVHAYLVASNSVIVPRQANQYMKIEALRARDNALYQDENDQIGALNIALDAAISAAPDFFHTRKGKK